MHAGKRVRIVTGLSCCFVLALCIALCGFTPTAKAETALEPIRAASEPEDATIMQTYWPELQLVNAPTVVLDVTNTGAWESIQSGERRPSNAIVTLTSDGSVTASDGSALGTFADVYNQVLLPRNIIPVVRIESDASADAAVKLLTQDLPVLDVAVLSSTPSLVKKVRSAATWVRGIVQYKQGTSPSDWVHVTNANYANVAIVPQKAATADNVRYVHARFKTVWVIPDSGNEFDLYDCIGSGAYGIVTDNFENVYDVLSTYDAEDGHTRTPFNVGHRGIPQLYNENSVQGTLAAIEMGATHVELDAFMTTDKEIVFSHDREIARVSDGSGDIESFSLRELQRYKLDLFTPNETFPTFEDIVNTLLGSDVILVLEIKSTLPDFAQVLRQKTQACDFFDQMVVISFEYETLEGMKNVMPEIPTADLNAVYSDNFAQMLLTYGAYNTGVDTKYSGPVEMFNERVLRDHGFVGWYWTFDNLVKMMQADNAGYVGLATDLAQEFAQVFPMKIEGISDIADTDLEVGDDVAVRITYYTGETRQDKGKVFACRDCGSYWQVVAVYDKYYTQSFRIEKKKAGCGGTLTGLHASAAAVLLLGCAVWMACKRRKACAASGK